MWDLCRNSYKFIFTLKGMLNKTLILKILISWYPQKIWDNYLIEFQVFDQIN